MTGKFALLIVALFVAQAATAQFAPLDGAGAWRCRAAAGDYETQDLPSAGNRMTVQIRLEEGYRHRRWAPAAGFWFVLRGRRRRAGVQVFIDADRPDRLMIGVLTPSSRTRPTILASVPRGAPAEATVSLDEGGLMTVAAEGRSSTVRLLNAAPLGRQLMCSTGSFTFEFPPAPSPPDPA